MKSITCENSAEVLAKKQYNTKQTKGKTMETTITNQPSLQDLEEKIETGLERYRIAGEALRMIKEQGLYKSQYNTYDEYCRQRWNITPQHANRMIKATEVVESIAESEPIGSVLPKLESQARALAKAENPSEAWRKSQEESGTDQPTSEQIRESVKKEHAEVIEAEVIGGDTMETEVEVEADTNSATELLTEIIDTPYEMGCITGRPQVSVGVDNASVARLEELRNHLHTSKASIVANSLLLMEKLIESQHQPTSNVKRADCCI